MYEYRSNTMIHLVHTHKFSKEIKKSEILSNQMKQEKETKKEDRSEILYMCVFKIITVV